MKDDKQKMQEFKELLKSPFNYDEERLSFFSFIFICFLAIITFAMGLLLGYYMGIN